MKTCSLCDADFNCVSDQRGCWCEQVQISSAALALFRARADDCVCPQCLGDFAVRDSSGERFSRLSRRRLFASVAVLAAAVLVGLAIGPFSVPPAAIAKSAVSWIPGAHVHSGLTPIQRTIVWRLRAPRLVLAGIVGATLGCAGSAYQGVFRNALADPYLLGVAAGAGFGATIVIAFDAGRVGGAELLPVAAFVGAIVAVAATYALGRSVAGRSTGTLILAGIAVTAFFTALQIFVQQQRIQSLQDVYSWLLGGFSTASWQSVILVLPYVLVSWAVILVHGRTLDVLSVGDEEAASLGLPVSRTRLLIIVAATIGTSAAVAVSGLIGFVGIIVPHTVRLLISSSYRVIVVLSLILGAAFLILADTLARTVQSPSEVPIGVITAICGAPFFVLILKTTTSVER